MKQIKVLLILTFIAMFSINSYAVDEQYDDFGIAIRSNKLNIVKEMVESGAVDVNKMSTEISPLGLAIELGKDKIVEYLLSRPDIDINVAYYDVRVGAGGRRLYKTAILSAIGRGEIELIQTLLDMGANVDYYSKTTYADGSFHSDTTPLLSALHLEYSDDAEKVVQQIADKTTNINRTFTYEAIPDANLISRAIGDDADDRYKYNNVLRSLIDRGAKIETFWKPTDTGIAALRQYADAATIAAYEKNQKYMFSSVVMNAAMRGNGEILDYLIQKGAKYEYYSDKGATVFCTCINAETVEVLVKRGVDVNTVHPGSGWPLLFTAASLVLDSDLLDGLLRLGADPYMQVNGVTVASVIKTYPSKRKKAVAKVYEKYGYEVK
ncbi:MAG: hypothetical protein R3Y22_05625 [Bacteroidales bacterium]